MTRNDKLLILAIIAVLALVAAHAFVSVDAVRGGRKVISFAGVLQQGVLPLPEVMQMAMKYGADRNDSHMTGIRPIRYRAIIWPENLLVDLLISITSHQAFLAELFSPIPLQGS